MVGRCSACAQPWERYQSQDKCSTCKMEMLVCRECSRAGVPKQRALLCWLCEEARAARGSGGAGGGAEAERKLKRAREFAAAGGGRDGEGEGKLAMQYEEEGGGGGGGGRGGGFAGKRQRG